MICKETVVEKTRRRNEFPSSDADADDEPKSVLRTCRTGTLRTSDPPTDEKKAHRQPISSASRVPLTLNSSLIFTHLYVERLW
jgi:hypothetical protein